MVMKKKQRIKGQKLKQGTLYKYILKTLSENPRDRFTPRQIIKKLKIANHADTVKMALDDLASNNQILKVKENLYRSSKEHASTRASKFSTDEQLVGVVDMTKNGTGYVICEGTTNDVFVSARNLNGARNGDKVLINSWVPKGRRNLKERF